VRESVDDTLSIEITGDSAHIKGQDSHFKIFTQPTSEFPPVPDFEAKRFEVPGGQLKQLIGQTLLPPLERARAMRSTACCWRPHTRS